MGLPAVADVVVVCDDVVRNDVVVEERFSRSSARGMRALPPCAALLWW